MLCFCLFVCFLRKKTNDCNMTLGAPDSNPPASSPTSLLGSSRGWGKFVIRRMILINRLSTYIKDLNTEAKIQNSNQQCMCEIHLFSQKVLIQPLWDIYFSPPNTAPIKSKTLPMTVTLHYELFFLSLQLFFLTNPDTVVGDWLPSVSSELTDLKMSSVKENEPY